MSRRFWWLTMLGGLTALAGLGWLLFGQPVDRISLGDGVTVATPAGWGATTYDGSPAAGSRDGSLVVTTMLPGDCGLGDTLKPLPSGVLPTLAAGDEWLSDCRGYVAHATDATGNALWLVIGSPSHDDSTLQAAVESHRADLSEIIASVQGLHGVANR